MKVLLYLVPFLTTHVNLLPIHVLKFILVGTSPSAPSACAKSAPPCACCSPWRLLFYMYYQVVCFLNTLTACSLFNQPLQSFQTGNQCRHLNKTNTKNKQRQPLKHHYYLPHHHHHGCLPVDLWSRTCQSLQSYLECVDPSHEDGQDAPTFACREQKKNHGVLVYCATC